MTRTLHVIFGADVGGLESAAADLIEELQHRGGGQSMLLLSENPGPLTDRVASVDGVPISIQEYAGKWNLVRSVRDHCRAEQIDCVLIYMFGLHVWVAAGARRAGAKKVFTLVGNPAPARGRGRFKNLVLAQAGRLFTDGEVACSGYVMDSLQSRYLLPRHRIHVIWNWCRIERFSPISGLDATDKLIGMVARLDPIKDHPMVIESFAFVHGTHPSCRLVLAGDGTERRRLESLVGSKGLDGSVDFLGTVPDVASLLHRLQVFAFATTADEGFGIALIEAMAAGLPIVATDVGPVAEVVADAGILVPPGNVTAMGAALASVLADDSFRRSLSTRSLERAQRFDVSHAAASFTRLLSI